MARITKDPEERRGEIMDAAEELFISKGFEQTSISDIVKKIGVAQGLFYYYFKSKGEILNAVLERCLYRFMQKIVLILEDTAANAVQKLQLIIDEIFSLEKGKENIWEYIHCEENSVMHNLFATKVLAQFVPILSSIIEQGVMEGVFDTQYPKEVAEVLLIGLGCLHDYPKNGEDREVFRHRVKAAVDILERALGAATGSFNINRLG